MDLREVILNQFGPIEQSQLDNFIKLWSVPITVKRNERLIRYQETENHVYFIEKGTCCITYPDINEDIVVGFGYPNTFLFSPSIINNKPTEQEVIMIKQSNVRSLHKRYFFEFINHHLEVQKKWQRQIELLLVAQIDRQIDLLISSPEERLKRLLIRSPHVFQLIPKKYIASYLRMTPETLSRIQKP